MDRFERMKDILFEAASLSDEARRPFLDEACRDDPELRREVESLLAHHDVRQPIMETGAVVPPGALSPESEPLSPESPPLTGHVGGYRILRKLGQGGMGTVYLAEDTKLHRSVALKFLLPQSAAGDEARTRLVHEARAAAALDHPNVCTIYEINESEGRTFIAMAYVEGTTLRERIASGPLSVEEAVSIGAQIAAGLRQAHERGIVHRDLKPSNIMLSSSGPAKIMDFGLARSRGRSEITKTGARIGTIGYMSPEQMRGEKVDHRTDIWALGVVLHEMLTGRLPFKGDSDHALGYNIVHEKQKRVGEAREDVPSVLETLIARCLEKKPDDRLDAAEALEVLDALQRASGEADAARVLRRRRHRVAWSLSVTGLTLLAVVAGVWLWRVSDGAPLQPRLTRLTVLPDDVKTSLLQVAISPDGRYLALPLRHMSGDWSALNVMSVETGRMRVIDGPAGEVYAIGWMPDSETLLTYEYAGGVPWRLRNFVDGSREQIWLRNIVLNTSRKIYESEHTTSLWPAASPDGEKIALFREHRRALWVMNSSGENLRMIREVPRGPLGNPVWSPSASRVAYTRTDKSAGRGAIVTIETCDLRGDTTVVLEGGLNIDRGSEGNSLCWLPDGRLIFARLTNRTGTTSALWSVSVDPMTGHRTGNPQPVLEQDGSLLSQLTASADGRRLSFIRWDLVNRTGLLELSEHGDGIEAGRWTSQDWPAYPGAWTRDGRRLFFMNQMGNADCDIYVTDMETRLEEPIVRTPELEWVQCLTPDGSAVLYWQGDRIMRMPVDGGPATEIFRDTERVTRHLQAIERVLCAKQPGAPCLLKRIEGDTTVFYGLDPEDGTVQEEIARVDLRLTGIGWWDLSPDGTRVALVAGQLWVLELTDGSLREIEGSWRGYPRSVYWSADGTWLVAIGTHGDATNWMRRVELDGSSRLLWASDDEWMGFAASPSPDGSHIAYTTSHSEGDVWMLEDF